MNQLAPRRPSQHHFGPGRHCSIVELRWEAASPQQRASTKPSSLTQRLRTRYTAARLCSPMSSRRPLAPRNPSICPDCRTDALVRKEHVVTGREAFAEYYCGRCNKRWRVRDALGLSKA